MIHVDRAVRRETCWIALWVLGLSVLMELIFVLLGRWNWPVLWGNLFGGGVAVINFFLMGLTVQKAVGREQKQIKNIVRSSQSLRLLMQAAVMVIAFLVGWLDPWATILPLFFPRVAITLRPLWDASLRQSGASAGTSGEELPAEEALPEEPAPGADPGAGSDGKPADDPPDRIEQFFDRRFGSSFPGTPAQTDTQNPSPTSDRGESD